MPHWSRFFRSFAAVALVATAIPRRLPISPTRSASTAPQPASGSCGARTPPAAQTSRSSSAESRGTCRWPATGTATAAIRSASSCPARPGHSSSPTTSSSRRSSSRSANRTISRWPATGSAVRTIWSDRSASLRTSAACCSRRCWQRPRPPLRLRSLRRPRGGGALDGAVTSHRNPYRYSTAAQPLGIGCGGSSSSLPYFTTISSMKRA